MRLGTVSTLELCNGNSPKQKLKAIKKNKKIVFGIGSLTLLPFAVSKLKTPRMKAKFMTALKNVEKASNMRFSIPAPTEKKIFKCSQLFCVKLVI